MSSVDESNYARRLAALLAAMANPDHRLVVQRYLAEKQAVGVKTSTLINDAGALRDLGGFLRATRFEEATRDQLIAFANLSIRQRVWTSLRRDGRATRTRLQPQAS